MKTNDLNKPSEKEMDLNSENTTETTGKEMQSQEPERVDHTAETDQPEAREPSEMKEETPPQEKVKSEETTRTEPEDSLAVKKQAPLVDQENKPESPPKEQSEKVLPEAPSFTSTPKEPVTDEPAAETAIPGPHEKEDKEVPVIEAKEEEPQKKEPAEEAAAKTETQPKPSPEDLLAAEEVDYSTLPREKLLERFRNLLRNHPLHIVKGHLDAIREAFNAQTAEEQAAIKKRFLDSGEIEENFSPPADPLFAAFGELLQEYRKARDDNRKRREEEKDNNLKAKYEVIEGIKDLVNRQESLNATFQEFRDLQQKWRETGPVPPKELHDLWENYHLHVENFYNYIKINKELRDLDLKKNLETKLELCEKAEKLLLEPTIVKAFKTLQKYHDQWRETGPVPHEKKEELWERFKEATAKINQKHQEHFENIKEQFERNLEAKRELCEKAEALVQKEYRNPREWEKASKHIIDLQQLWKTIGFAPKKENTEVYHRFRKACDLFFGKKREFFKQFKEAQNNNLQLKTELCLQAEALKDSEEWKTTTHEFIRIQRRWKEIGPVPRKHSDDIWKRFREACDHFFNKKTAFFSKKDETQENNLKMKEELIEELKQYKPVEGNEENFNNLQAFQNRWSQIGFVPFRDKDRVNNEFRELINSHFDEINMDETNKMLHKYRSKLESWKSEGQFNERITQERNKIIGKLREMENDISVWENNIGFFAKSKKSEALLRDFTHKIENGKSNIQLQNRKLDLIDEMLRQK